jgi:hypothetical protein
LETPRICAPHLGGRSSAVERCVKFGRIREKTPALRSDRWAQIGGSIRRGRRVFLKPKAKLDKTAIPESCLATRTLLKFRESSPPPPPLHWATELRPSTRLARMRHPDNGTPVRQGRNSENPWPPAKRIVPTGKFRECLPSRPAGEVLVGIEISMDNALAIRAEGGHHAECFRCDRLRKAGSPARETKGIEGS